MSGVCGCVPFDCDCDLWRDVGIGDGDEEETAVEEEEADAEVGCRESGGWEKDFDLRIGFSRGFGCGFAFRLGFDCCSDDSGVELLLLGTGTRPFHASEDNTSVLDRALMVRLRLCSPGERLERKLRFDRRFQPISGVYIINISINTALKGRYKAGRTRLLRERGRKWMQGAVSCSSSANSRRESLCFLGGGDGDVGSYAGGGCWLLKAKEFR